MPATNIRGGQILNATVQRQDLDTSTVGQAVVTKLIQGSNITLNSTGADAGTGDVTISHPIAVSSDTGNIATLGSDNLILVPQSTLWSTRLRSYNAVGNPNFEVDQLRNGTSSQVIGKIVDRWIISKAGTMAFNNGAILNAGGPVLLPGTNFGLSNYYLRHALTTTEPTLAAGDYLYMSQQVEGSGLRELISDVHSVSLLVRSSVAGLTFGLSIRDPTGSRSLTKLCTIPSANTVTLISLSNLPVFPSAGTFSTAPGSVGYIIAVTLAAGATFTSPANDVWQTGNFLGATGQSNFAANASATFDLMFVQHEPGPVCTTLIDKPFAGANGNYAECLRYYEKSYDYATAPGTATVTGMAAFIATAAAGSALGPLRFKVPMAKTPTVTLYNHSTGAANSVQDNSGVNHASAAALGPGLNGLYGINFATATTTGMAVYGHYTADTGW